MTTEREQAFNDAPLYEIEGAIRGKADDAIAAFIAHARESSREQTAATILAALTTNRMVPGPGNPLLDDDDRNNVRYAVALADALRAELQVKP